MGEVQGSYAEALNNPQKNLKTLKVVRYTLNDDGDKQLDLPGMSKEHWEGKFLPELEKQRREINLKRIQCGDSPFRAVRAAKHVRGKSDTAGNQLPNFGLLVPYDNENSMWLQLAISCLQLRIGTTEDNYRYDTKQAYEAGKGSVVLSFKVNKLGSDVSPEGWESFCFDNNIDSSMTRRLEPKHHAGEIEVVFAASKDLVRKLRAHDANAGRQPGKVLYLMQGEKELLYKTKPLMAKSLEQLDFAYGHL